MRKKHPFFQDTSARIPFSVIGIFLIIGSSFTSAIISNLEEDKSYQYTSTINLDELSRIIRFAEADIARALNYAGMFALDKIGKTPVTYSSLSNSVATGYAVGITNNNNVIDTLEESVMFNKNWARNITRVQLNKFLNVNFKNNRCQYGDYVVNVIGIIKDFTSITFTPLRKELTRAVSVPLITEHNNGEYETYWVASVPIQITVTQLSTGEQKDFTINPETIITSRLPFLMELTHTFIESISEGNNGLTDNKLMILVTLISVIYTAARGLIQYAWPGKIKNIVANQWLKYVTNAGIVTEEFLVFNSVDPLSLVKLITNAGDFVANSGKSESDLLQSAGVSFLTSGIGDIKDEVMSRVDDTLAQQQIPNHQQLLQEMNETIQNASKHNNYQVISVQNVSEDILYKVLYTYHYHRIDNDSNPLDIHGNILDLSNPTDLKHVYLQHNNTDSEKKDKFAIHWRDTTNKKYSYVIGDPITNKTFTRDNQSLTVLNRNVETEIEHQLNQSYRALVHTQVQRNYVDGYYENSAPNPNHKDVLDIDTGSTWTVVSKKCLDQRLGEDINTMTSTSHTETWNVQFERVDTFTICTKWNTSSGKCEQDTEIDYSYYEEYTITFSISVDYPDADVATVFISTNIFGTPPHPIQKMDNNLQIILSEFPDYFINNIRDDILDSRSNNNVPDKKYSYDKPLTNLYGVDFLQTLNGCVVEALQNITDMITADELLYRQCKEQFSGESHTLDDMQKGRIAILDVFTNQYDKYLNEDYYKDTNGFYISTGAKVVCKMREWFLNQILDNLSIDQTDKIETEINKRLDDEQGEKLQEYNDIQQEHGGTLDQIGSLGGVRCGLVMDLDKNPDPNNWHEQVSVAIDRDPKYLTFNKKDDGKNNWYFNIRNTCLFGPTGLPLLPIPPIPWFCTINLWEINVDGCFENYTVWDTHDETHANPLFGHEGQIYKRYDFDIFDDWCGSGISIGETKRVIFNFWTMNFAIVPPGKLPLGDIEGGIFEYDDQE